MDISELSIETRKVMTKAAPAGLPFSRTVICFCVERGLVDLYLTRTSILSIALLVDCFVVTGKHVYIHLDVINREVNDYMQNSIQLHPLQAVWGRPEETDKLNKTLIYSMAPRESGSRNWNVTHLPDQRK